MEQTPVSCRMTSCESSLTKSWHIPCEITLERSSINALYPMMFVIDRPIHIPLKLTNSPLGAKMAQAAEDRLCILRLAPLAYPTNGSKNSDICNKCEVDYLTKMKTLKENKNATKSYVQ